jgi:hypothetical protein
MYKEQLIKDGYHTTTCDKVCICDLCISGPHVSALFHGLMRQVSHAGKDLFRISVLRSARIPNQ